MLNFHLHQNLDIFLDNKICKVKINSKKFEYQFEESRLGKDQYNSLLNFLNDWKKDDELREDQDFPETEGFKWNIANQLLWLGPSFNEWWLIVKDLKATPEREKYIKETRQERYSNFLKREVYFDNLFKLIIGSEYKEYGILIKALGKRADSDIIFEIFKTIDEAHKKHSIGEKIDSKKFYDLWDKLGMRRR